MRNSKCLICSSTSLRKLNKITRVDLVKCNNCSFVFAEKIPTHDELIKAYTTSYTREYIVSNVNMIRYNEYLDYFEKYRKTNNLLEIGAGVGFFAKLAKERGWNVSVTEFDDIAVQKCRDIGLEVHQGKLDSNNYPENYFDVVFSTEVIEHINNPLEEIGHIYKILRKEGVCFVTTPNFNSLSRRILGNNWAVIHYPGHLSYYTPQTLKKLFLDYNFSDIWVRTNAISINKFINHSSAQSITKLDENIRMSAEKNLLLNLIKRTVNYILRVFNLGDSLKGFFIKK